MAADTEVEPLTPASLPEQWRGPLIGGLVALAIAFAVCVGLVALGHATFPGEGDPPRFFKQYVPLIEGGGATFYGFQRVPVTLELRESTTERVNNQFEDPENADIRIVASPLGGLFLVGLALIVGGVVSWRLREQQDQGLFATTARMAVVFALACFILSFALASETTKLDPRAFARRSTFLSYAPSPLGALIWPFTWGLAFGSLGALIARDGRNWRSRLITAIEARSAAWAAAVRAALTGIATGITLVLLAGVLTAVVGTASHTEQSSDVLGSGKNVAGIAEGIVIGLPHASGAGVLGSMGISGHYEITDRDVREFLTAKIFGGERQRRNLGRRGIGEGGPASFRYGLPMPRYALGGLLIAVAFTVVTGYRAGSLRAALMAAAVLTIFLWILAYLIGGNFRLVHTIERSRNVIEGWAGPGTIAETIVLPLVWTFGGGLIGALLARLRSVRRVRRV